MIDDRAERINAVVVTYQPQPQPLIDLLEALVPQVSCVLIIDNTPSADIRMEDLLRELALPQVKLIRLGDNFGIAKALNIGIELAFRDGANYVLLSDQDSLPMPAMVANLLLAAQNLSKQGVAVGGVGPTYTDASTGITFPFQAQSPGKVFYRQLRASAKRPLVEALSLITSGTLIPAVAYVAAGPMREDFFIDHVDIEWCHRIRAAGFKLYGIASARMVHRMGDAQLKVWYFGWHLENLYSPLRVYYRVRNFIVLCKMRFIPWHWKLRNFLYWIKFLYGHGVFGNAKLQTLRMAMLGLSDGLKGRMGRYPDNQHKPKSL